MHGRSTFAHVVAPPMLDLAAMVFVGDERPDGFSPPFSQGYRPGDSTRDDLDQAQLGVARGFTANYLTVGDGAESTLYPVILHIAAFDTDEQAANGLEIFADADRRYVGSVVASTNLPAPSLDARPTRLTMLVSDYQSEDGPVVQTHDFLFQTGPIVAGVRVDRYLDGGDPKYATPLEAAVATPLAIDVEVVKLATDLAQRFAGRIDDVLAGIAPAGVDFTWPSHLLPVHEMWPEAWERTHFVFEGYRTVADLAGGNGSLGALATDFHGGYFRATAISDVLEDTMPPAVTVSLMVFRSTVGATDTFNAIEAAPNDLPLPATEASLARRLVSAPTLSGVDSVLAYTSPDTEGGPVNSAGVVFVIGERLMAVDVQSVRSADDALAAAIELAQAQVSCMTGPTCTPIPIPSTIADL